MEWFASLVNAHVQWKILSRICGLDDAGRCAPCRLLPVRLLEDVLRYRSVCSQQCVGCDTTDCSCLGGQNSAALAGISPPRLHMEGRSL